MSRSSWTETWMEVSKTIAKRSKCDRAQVGAVIVDKNHRVIATGYNGPASGLFKYEGNCTNWCERAKNGQTTENTYDTCPSIHAEANALLYVDRSAIEGATIYITHPPCFSCAKLISNSGIKNVTCTQQTTDSHRNPEKIYEYLKQAGISVIPVFTETEPQSKQSKQPKP